MAFWLVRVLQALLVVFALGGLVAGLYSYYRYPWHRVNRESRVPVRRTTVEVARRCVSAAFLLFVPVAVGGALSFVGTMAELRASATGGTPGYTAVEHVALALPWEGVAAVSLVLTLWLVFLPIALAVVDVAKILAGGGDPPESA